MTDWFGQLPPENPEVITRISFRPRWDGENCPSSTLLVWHEYGYGDAINFSAYLGIARHRVGRLVLMVDMRLARLMALVPGVDEICVRGRPAPEHDYHCSLMGLPRLLNENRSIPLPALGVAVLPPIALPDSLGGLMRPRVGVCWQGNRGHGWDHRRSFSSSFIVNLTGIDGVSLIRLQKGESAAVPHLSDLGLQYEKGDWLDTAAMIRNLDLVIGPDTAILHLTGSLGIPAWIALADPCDWRWNLGSEPTRSVWYDSVRLFRQQRSGDWTPVFEDLARMLASFAASYC